MSTLVATLGFDLGHIVRVVVRMHGTSPIRRAILLVSKMRGAVDPRARGALSDAAKLLGMLGIGVEAVEVEVDRPLEAFAQLSRALLEAARAGDGIVLDLSGGTRVLVSLVALAAFSRPEIVEAVAEVIWEVEGAGVELRLSGPGLRGLVSQAVGGPSKAEEAVLRVLQEIGPARLAEIHRRLREKGYTWTKQYTHRILTKLVERGVVLKTARGKYRAHS